MYKVFVVLLVLDVPWMAGGEGKHASGLVNKVKVPDCSPSILLRRPR